MLPAGQKGNRPAAPLSTGRPATLAPMAERGQEQWLEDEDDEDKKSGRALGARRKFDEFECPSCSADNPWGDTFGNGDEVLCNWCGQSFRALVDNEGSLTLKDL